MPASSRKHVLSDSEADTDGLSREENSAPLRMVLTGPDFSLDDLLEQRQISREQAAASPDDAWIWAGGPRPGTPTDDLEEDEVSSEEELPQPRASPDAPRDDSASDSNDGPRSGVSDQDEDPGLATSPRQHRTKRPRAERSREGTNPSEEEAVKRSTRANRLRRVKRKQSESRLRALQGSLLRKALTHVRELDLRTLPHASTSYIGRSSNKDDPSAKAKPFKPDGQGAASPATSATHERLQELVAQGYTVVDSHSAPDLIFDGKSRLGAWKPGAFGHSRYWDFQVRGLSRSFQTFRDGISEARSKRKRREKTGGGSPRGRHTWATWGYSVGSGEQEPTSSAQLNLQERRLWLEFLACPFFQRVTAHLMDSFEMWAPEVYAKYEKCHQHVISQMRALDCINSGAPDSVPFAALTANLGPQTVCWPHQDIKNLANGLCIILVLGTFDHRYGGHIVLHEPRLVLEMRPGDAVYLPSAVITHETIPIKAGETRYSLVFYSAGGLFRWHDCASRTRKEYAAQDKEGCEAHFSSAKSEARWAAGWNCFPTLEDLLKKARETPSSVSRSNTAVPMSSVTTQPSATNKEPG